MIRSVEVSAPTKGPWAVADDGTVRSRDFEGSTQMGDYKGVIVCDTSPAHGSREHALSEAAANAHLIAAAPDLLALAQKIASECAECRGRGYTFADDGITGFGPDDREPTREACAECADIREVITKAVGP